MPFTGKATYDTSVFDDIAEDVSDLIGMISPAETPLLDRLGDPAQSAQNVLHEWLEDALSPNTIVASSTMGSAVTVGGFHVGGANIGTFLQAGAVVNVKRTGEYMQIASTTAGSITFTRAFGGTTAATIVAGDELFIISDVGLEGADVSVDTSRPRSRKNNYTQIFKKDIIVSGTVQAVNMLGGIENEFDYQKMKKIKETVRDLEKAAIQGKSSGNTLGSATAYRTFRGIWDSITTNSTSMASISPDTLNDTIQLAWNNGATDCDIIVCDPNWMKLINKFNDARILTPDTNQTYRRRIYMYEGTFGTQEVIMSRWMPRNSLMVLSSQRVKVMPLKGRSYQYMDVARTGDSSKGMVLGEYTVEVKNEEGLAKAYGASS